MACTSGSDSANGSPVVSTTWPVYEAYLTLVAGPDNRKGSVCQYLVGGPLALFVSYSMAWNPYSQPSSLSWKVSQDI